MQQGGEASGACWGGEIASFPDSTPQLFITLCIKAFIHSAIKSWGVESGNEAKGRGFSTPCSRGEGGGEGRGFSTPCSRGEGGGGERFQVLAGGGERLLNTMQ